jgi:hypothetical protein
MTNSHQTAPEICDCGKPATVILSSQGERVAVCEPCWKKLLDKLNAKTA